MTFYFKIHSISNTQKSLVSCKISTFFTSSSYWVVQTHHKQCSNGLCSRNNCGDPALSSSTFLTMMVSEGKGRGPAATGRKMICHQLQTGIQRRTTLGYFRSFLALMLQCRKKPVDAKKANILVMTVSDISASYSSTN